MFSGPLHKSCRKSLGSKLATPQEVVCFYRAILLNLKLTKIFFTETMRLRAKRLSMELCLVVSYINPANPAPGVQTGHTMGVIISHTYNGINLKNLLF